MASLYEFMANDFVQNMPELEGYGEQLKQSKRLFVTGTYNREYYKGDDFNWVGRDLELYSLRSEEQIIYLCIRTDFLGQETVRFRLINEESAVAFEQFDSFSYKSAQFSVFKAKAPFHSYAKITLRTQGELDDDNRELSIPLSRVLLTSPDFKVSITVLRFWLLTGTISADCDIYPNSTSADKVADFFNDVSRELANES